MDESLALVSIGEILIDFVAADADDLESAEIFVPAAGGAAANVAVAAARMGARTSFIGAVGQDPFGRLLVRTLQDNGVDIDGVQVVPAHTTLAFVARNQGGIPDFLFYREADTGLLAQHVPREEIQTALCLHASSLLFTHAASRDAVLEAVAIAQDADVLICVDPNLRPSIWPSVEEAVETVAPLVEAASIRKVNEDEARLLTGEGDLSDALGKLSRDGSLAVITLGAEGCLWGYGGESGRIVAPTIAAVDTTGAGDAFVGAMLAELLSRGYKRDTFGLLGGGEIVEILEVATVAGALACLRPGAIPSLPTRDEVHEALSAQRDGTHPG